MDGFLLAGGKSSRMGRNKALLEVGGAPLIRRVADALRSVADRVTVITRTPEDYRFLGLPVLGDAIPDAGPLGGIYTALRATRSDACFVLACDLPLVRPALLGLLAEEAQGFDAAVPRTGDGDHPLCAVYGRGGLAQAGAQIDAGDLKVTRFLGRVRTRWVGVEAWGRADPEGLSFVNVNTPEAYEKVRAMLLREAADGRRET